MASPNRWGSCRSEAPTRPLSRLPVRGTTGLGRLTESSERTTPSDRGFVPPDTKELADKFPQLEIIELLGHGGMGAVYKARQKQLDRLVALKILPREVGQSEAFAERFTREARSLARLNHPPRESIPPAKLEAWNVNRSKRVVWEPPAAAFNRTSASGLSVDPRLPVGGCTRESPSRPDPPWRRSTPGPRSAVL